MTFTGRVVADISNFVLTEIKKFIVLIAGPCKQDGGSDMTYIRIVLVLLMIGFLGAGVWERVDFIKDISVEDDVKQRKDPSFTIGQAPSAKPAQVRMEHPKHGKWRLKINFYNEIQVFKGGVNTSNRPLPLNFYAVEMDGNYYVYLADSLFSIPPREELSKEHALMELQVGE